MGFGFERLIISVRQGSKASTRISAKVFTSQNIFSAAGY